VDPGSFLSLCVATVSLLFWIVFNAFRMDSRRQNARRYFESLVKIVPDAVDNQGSQDVRTLRMTPTREDIESRLCSPSGMRDRGDLTELWWDSGFQARFPGNELLDISFGGETVGWSKSVLTPAR
jgi:hypothetical protein